MSIELMMPPNHSILCHPLLFLPSVFPSIKVFSIELDLRIRWPKYWSFSFSISPSNEYSGLISIRINWSNLFAVPGTFKSLLHNTIQNHQLTNSKSMCGILPSWDHYLKSIRLGFYFKVSYDVFELWCWRRLENPLDCIEIKQVNPKGNQPWIITRINAEAEAPIPLPLDEKSWLIGKDPDAGKDWRQEEKGATEDEMDGWHHSLNGHEFEQTLGDGEGLGSLVCCSSLGLKELDSPR